MGDHLDLTQSGARSVMFDMINGYWRTQIVCSAAELRMPIYWPMGRRASRRWLAPPASMRRHCTG